MRKSDSFLFPLPSCFSVLMLTLTGREALIRRKEKLLGWRKAE